MEPCCITPSHAGSASVISARAAQLALERGAARYSGVSVAALSHNSRQIFAYVGVPVSEGEMTAVKPSICESMFVPIIQPVEPEPAKSGVQYTCDAPSSVAQCGLPFRGFGCSPYAALLSG